MGKLDKLRLVIEYVMTAHKHDTAFKDDKGQSKLLFQ